MVVSCGASEKVYLHSIYHIINISTGFCEFIAFVFALILLIFDLSYMNIHADTTTSCNMHYAGLIQIIQE